MNYEFTTRKYKPQIISITQILKNHFNPYNLWLIFFTIDSTTVRLSGVEATNNALRIC